MKLKSKGKLFYVKIFSALTVVVLLLLFSIKPGYALENVDSFSYEGNALNYLAGEDKAQIESDILDGISIIDTDFVVGDITISYSVGAFTEDKLNGGAHKATLTALVGEKEANPVVLNIYAITDYVDYTTDRAGTTNQVFSTGIIPTTEQQPNTIESWVYIPSGLAAGDLGYVTGNGAGGTGANSINLVFYGSGYFSLFWKGANRPAIGSQSALKVPFDTWTHVAAVRDKENQVIRYYINGELIYTTDPLAIIGQDQDASLAPEGYKEYKIGIDGREQNNRRMPGYLSTVSVSATEKTQAQIQADMGLALTGGEFNDDNRWIWVDFNDQSMSFEYAEEKIEVGAGLSIAAVQAIVDENATVLDMIGRDVSTTVSVSPELLVDGSLVQGTGVATISATDAFGNTESWDVPIEITSSEPMLVYNGSTVTYEVGLTKDELETLILEKTDVVNYTDPVSFVYSTGAITDGLLNGGGFTVTMSIPDVDPVVIELYGITDYVDFTTDRTGQTSKSYSTGVVPPIEQQPNTIEAWVYVPSGQNPDALGYVTGNGAGGSGENTVNLVFNGSGYFSLFWKGANRPAIGSQSALKVPFDTWTHVAAVRDKENQVIRYYINGELIYTTDPLAIIGQDQDASLAPEGYKEYGIGKDGRTQLDRRFPGWISTVAIYSVARTQAEIKADMALALTGGEFTDVDKRWIWVDFNDQSMSFEYAEEKIEVGAGLSIAAVQAIVDENATVLDMIGRDVSTTVSVSPELLVDGSLVQGTGVATISATDAFGNTESWDVPIEITSSEPMLVYNGSTVTYEVGLTKDELETLILEKTDVVNYTDPVSFVYSTGAITDGLLNGGGFTVTMSIPDVDPVVIELYGITDYVDFTTDRTGQTSKAYSTGVVPPIEQQPNTIEAWVYVPSGQNPDALGYVTGNGAGGSGENTVNLVFYGSGYFSLFWKGANRPAIGSQSALKVPFDTWTHVAAVRDKENQVIRYYINGELIYTTDPLAIIGQDQDASLAPEGYKEYGIGKDGRTQLDRRFPGWISTVAIYSVARTQAEIKADMALALTGGEFTDVDKRWIWADFNDQSMTFEYPEDLIEVNAGVSATTMQLQLAALATAKDMLGRTTIVAATFDQELVVDGILVEGLGNVTFTATDLFGNTESFTVPVEVGTPIPMLFYNGSNSLSYLFGKAKSEIDEVINAEIEVVNYDGSVSIVYSNGAFTDNKLNVGGYTVTISIPGVEPISIYLYGIENYISFVGDRTGETNNAYSTGIIPKEQPNTIESWVYIPSGQNPDALGYVTGNGAGGSGENTVNLVFNGSGYFSLFWKGANRPAIGSQSALKVPFDTWTHVAAVRDKENQVIRYYINGELIYTTDPLAIIGQDQDASLAPEGYKEYGIGKDGRTQLDRRFPGWISTVAIYSVARTQAEIREDMLSAITGDGMTPESKLIYYANVFDVKNDKTAPVITFDGEKKFTANIGDFNTGFLDFLEEKMTITDNNLFSPVTYTVDYKGAVSPFDEFLKAGTFNVVVTAKDTGGNVAKVEVTLVVIDPNKVTEIEIVQKDSSIKVGGSIQLTVTKNPANSTEVLKWESSDTNIATVSQTGLVKGISKGTVTITVKNQSGSVVDTIEITINGNGLGGGAIAGIIIGSVVVCGGLGVLAWYLIRRKKKVV